MESDAEGPLVETLETWLDEGCDSRATVARLQVHRTSLYYRLGRIEEITGLSLNSGAARLDLHLGLKLARLQGLLGK
jgi:DNA-binding PucR family transcriptional regulator